MNNLKKRCTALRKAKRNAKDLEFKKVWQQHLKVLTVRSKK